VYGAYLRASLAEAVRSSPATFTHHQPAAVRIRPSCRGRSVTVDLDTGESIDADHVVLAVGWGEPEPLGPASPDLIVKPWATDWESALATLTDSSMPIAVIGTDLTATDVIGTLAEHGRANIIDLSPSGTFPAPHPDILQWPDTGPTVAAIAEASTAADLIHRTRTACAGRTGSP
jgi:uncharacterized NAD(P)/FAD-binding protein YdhS